MSLTLMQAIRLQFVKHGPLAQLLEPCGRVQGRRQQNKNRELMFIRHQQLRCSHLQLSEGKETKRERYQATLRVLPRDFTS